MVKPLSKNLALAGSLLFFFISLVTIGFFLFSSLTKVAYAQLNGCGEIDVGNPGANVTVPPQCAEGESAVVQNVIKLAKEHLTTGIYILGTPSRDWAADKSTGPDSPANFDCSGFVGWAWYWGSNGVISMDGQTNADWASNNPHYMKVVTTDESQLQPGDAVFLMITKANPNHIM